MIRMGHNGFGPDKGIEQVRVIRQSIVVVSADLQNLLKKKDLKKSKLPPSISAMIDIVFPLAHSLAYYILRNCIACYRQDCRIRSYRTLPLHIYDHIPSSQSRL